MRLAGLVAMALGVYCVLLPLSLVGVLAILVLGIVAAFGRTPTVTAAFRRWVEPVF